MTTATRGTRHSNRKAKAQKKAEYESKAEGAKLLGNIITWTPGQGPHAHTNVVKALEDAGLDQKVARELLPRYAFGRAAKAMSDNRVIDVLREDGDEIVFQFTARKLKDGEGEREWKYEKETLLQLNKTTGQISCKNKDLEELARKELAKSITDRTTGDITQMIQRLCDEQADLFPIRDQGGAYFVPVECDEFVGKIRMFLVKLGGKLATFPIVAGLPEGDASVQTTVSDHLAQLTSEYAKAIEEFGVETQARTLESMAEKIKQIRVKVKAYAHLLGDLQAELVDKDQKLEARLVERVNEIGTLKAERNANKPQREKGEPMGKDAFDCRLGSQAATINAVLTKKPQRLADIVKACGLPEARVKSHLKFMVEQKFVAAGSDGYKLVPQVKKAS